MKTLEELYDDSEGFQELREHIMGFIQKRAIDLAFNREDTAGMADAKEVIEAAFEDLDIKFGVVEAPKPKQPMSPR